MTNCHVKNHLIFKILNTTLFSLGGNKLHVRKAGHPAMRIDTSPIIIIYKIYFLSLPGRLPASDRCFPKGISQACVRVKLVLITIIIICMYLYSVCIFFKHHTKDCLGNVNKIIMFKNNRTLGFLVLCHPGFPT